MECGFPVAKIASHVQCALLSLGEEETRKWARSLTVSSPISKTGSFNLVGSEDGDEGLLLFPRNLQGITNFPSRPGDTLRIFFNTGQPCGTLSRERGKGARGGKGPRAASLSLFTFYPHNLPLSA